MTNDGSISPSSTLCRSGVPDNGAHTSGPAVKEAAGIGGGDAAFLVCQRKPKAEKFAARARERLCDALGLREKDAFRFCWIVDFQMYRSMRHRTDRQHPDRGGAGVQRHHRR